MPSCNAEMKQHPPHGQCGDESVHVDVSVGPQLPGELVRKHSVCRLWEVAQSILQRKLQGSVEVELPTSQCRGRTTDKSVYR